MSCSGFYPSVECFLRSKWHYMFAFAPSTCLFCDCSLACELQADVVRFGSICVYGVNIRCIWIFYFFPSFHLSVKAFSRFILFHLKHLKICLSLSCELLSVFQSVEKPVCGKGGRISLYSAPEYKQVLLPVCFLSVYCLLPVCFLSVNVCFLSVSCLFTVCFLSVYCLLPVCFLSASCLLPVCFLSVSCLLPVCFLSASCLFPVCFLSASCLWSVCLLSASCLFPVCFLSASCLFTVCFLSVYCMFPVCFLSVSCLLPVCFLSVSCLLPVCFLSVSCLLPVCFLSVSCLLPVCFLSASCLFPVWFLSASCLFTVCFLSVSCLLPVCFLSASCLFPVCDQPGRRGVLSLLSLSCGDLFFTWTILVRVFYISIILVSRLNSVKSFSFQWIFKSMNLYVMNSSQTSRLPWCRHVQVLSISQWVVHSTDSVWFVNESFRLPQSWKAWKYQRISKVGFSRLWKVIEIHKPF